MSEITIEVWDATGNKKQLVQLPADAAVNRVIAVLVRKMNLPQYSPDGQLMAMHRLGIVMAAAVLAQFPYCAVGLVWKKDYPLGHRFASIFAWCLIALLIGNWLFDVLTHAP